VPLLTFSRLKYLYLAYFSKPIGDRVVYRAIGRRKARKILEIGVGPSSRTLRMIDLARRGGGGEAVRYVAVDLFEARAAESTRGLSLKETHRLLKPTGAQVQLIPGDPAQALARSANALQNMDLVLISADHTEQSLSGAWFYLPRMLHATSQVFLESRLPEGPSTSLKLLTAAEIEALAGAHRRRKAA
jgi:hypothetical protein